MGFDDVAADRQSEARPAEAGVVGENELSGDVEAVVLGFDPRVGFEGVAVFDGSLDLLVFGEDVELDIVDTGGADEVADLAGVGGGYEDAAHFLNLPRRHGDTEKGRILR